MGLAWTSRQRKKGKKFVLKSRTHDTAPAGKEGASPAFGAAAVEATREMPVLGEPAVLGILPEELTGKDKARQEAVAAATKEETDLSGSPAENHRRMKTPKQVGREGTTL